MRKLITLSIAVLTSMAVSAQLPVSHTAGKKQVLIEVFTGNNCPNCALGHKMADDIVAANPGKAFSYCLHEQAESFAAPTQTGSLDFRVPEADNLLGIPNMLADPGLMGYPAGSVNRVVPTSPAVPYNPGGYLMSREYWTGRATAILAQNAYVNVAGQAYLNTTTRKLAINMEVYYTANSAVSSNRITIVLAQNNIIAYQNNASSYPAMNTANGYKHMHAVRDILTSSSSYEGVLGETMTGLNTAGTTWTKTYNFTVPASYPIGVTTKKITAVLADLELFAIITETSGNVIAVCKVPIGLNVGISDPSDELINFASVYPCPMSNEGIAAFTLVRPSNVNIEVINALGQKVISDDLHKLCPGEHIYNIDATKLNNGFYFVNIKAGETTITKRIAILK